MAMFSLHLKDKRCVRTREAVESAFFCFYARHTWLKKLPVVVLCRLANVSTPTFYRHYAGLHEVAEARRRRIKKQLKKHLEGDMRLIINLMRLFKFVSDNKLYYEANMFQMYSKPFEDIKIALESTILEYIRLVRRMSRAREVDDWICYEVSDYVILELKWWIVEEGFDSRKIDERVAEILLYTRQRIEDADKRMRG